MLTQKRSVLTVDEAVAMVPFARTTVADLITSSVKPQARLVNPNPPMIIRPG